MDACRWGYIISLLNYASGDKSAVQLNICNAEYNVEEILVYLKRNVYIELALPHSDYHHHHLQLTTTISFNNTHYLLTPFHLTPYTLHLISYTITC